MRNPATGPETTTPLNRGVVVMHAVVFWGVEMKRRRLLCILVDITMAICMNRRAEKW